MNGIGWCVVTDSSGATAAAAKAVLTVSGSGTRASQGSGNTWTEGDIPDIDMGLEDKAQKEPERTDIDKVEDEEIVPVKRETAGEPAGEEPDVTEGEEEPVEMIEGIPAPIITRQSGKTEVELGEEISLYVAAEGLDLTYHRQYRDEKQETSEPETISGMTRSWRQKPSVFLEVLTFPL